MYRPEPEESAVEKLANVLAETFQRAAAPLTGDQAAIFEQARQAINAQIAAEREELRQERAELQAMMEQMRYMAAFVETPAPEPVYQEGSFSEEEEDEEALESAAAAFQVSEDEENNWDEENEEERTDEDEDQCQQLKKIART